MKRKTWILGLLSLVGLGLAATDAFAFWWKWHNKYQSVVICRPYNAFTPVCYGNVVCDGCCPNNVCHAPSYMPNLFPPTYCGMPMPGYHHGCSDPCAGHGPVVSGAPPMHMPMPTGPVQTAPPAGQPQPGFTPPMPSPMPNMQQTYYQGTNIPMSYPPYYGYNYLPWNANIYPVSYQQGWPTGYSPAYWYGAYGR